MKNKHRMIGFLTNAAYRLWRFPWLKATLGVLVVSMLGMFVMNQLPAEMLETNILSQDAFAQQPQQPPAQPAAQTPAQPAGNQQQQSQPNIDELTNKLKEVLSGGASIMAQIAVFLMKIIGAFLMFMLYWMSDLMDNTFILDGGMGEKLQVIWIFVRNIVNILFAIALVVVAFINVAGFGGGEGSYNLKKFIPKMAIALIAVNFTFLAARVVLDVNNVLTTAVFSLPQNVPDLGRFTASDTVPLKLYAKYDCSLDRSTLKDREGRLLQDSGGNRAATSALGTAESNAGAYTQGQPIGNFFDICVADIQGSIGQPGADDKGLVSLGDQQINKNNFVWVMATRFQGIQNIAKVPLDAKDWEALITNANFAIIFAVIYAVAYLAMFIVLLVRVVVLWVCIALSPIIAVEILFPDLMQGFKIGDKDLKGTFLDHAFVPLKMAIPMSIGFIMISQMSLVSGSSFSGEILLTGGEFTRDGSFQRILYGIASVALIWMGVFSATKGVQGSQVIESIKGGVEGFGKFVGKLPLQFVPIVPVPGAPSVSLAALGEVSRAVKRLPEEHARRAGGALAGFLNIPGYEADQARARIGGIKDQETARNFMKDDWKHLQMWDDQRKAMLQMATASGITSGPIVNALRSARSFEDFAKTPEWQQFSTQVTQKLGISASQFRPQAAGTSNPQEAYASVADKFIGGSTDNIVVHIAQPITLAGASIGIGSRPLNPAQLREYFQSFAGRPIQFVEMLEESSALQAKIFNNPSLLITALEGHPDAMRIAGLIAGSTKIKGNTNVEQVAENLRKLGASQNASDIRTRLTQSQ